MDGLWQDLRHAVRTLSRSPGFTAVAVLTLALGIGANTTIFSVVRAVLLRPLPLPEPERVVRVWEADPKRGWNQFSVSQPNFRDWVAEAKGFEHLGAFQGTAFHLTGGGEPERVAGALASASLFQVYGVTPAQGRTFLPDEERAGGPRVVVLGHGLWERRYGADRSVVGRTIELSGASYEVVGILPPTFEFSLGVELWVPLVDDPAQANRSNHVLSVFGRMLPGVTLAQATSEMGAIARGLEQRYPESNAGWGVTLSTIDDWAVPEETRRALVVLLAGVGFVLLIACANVTNLLLARAEPQRRALAVRAALGATRGRLLRQLLTESLVLAVVGGVVGVLLALWGTDLIAASREATVSRLDETRVDGVVLAFTLLVSLGTALLSGSLPAWQASRAGVGQALREGGRITGDARRRLRGALVVGEVALTLMLLVGAGLMIRSLARLVQVPLGFAPENVLSAQINLPPTRYTDGDLRSAFFDRLLERLGTQPGVTGAAAITQVPFSGGNWAMEVAVEGREADRPLSADTRAVTPGYFRTMGIPVLTGRDFTDRDRGDPLVLIVNDRAAKLFWPGDDPLGKRLRPGPRNPWGTVVGVVADSRNLNLTDDVRPAFYFTNSQLGANDMTLVVQSALPPASVGAALRAEVLALDRDLPVFNVRPMDEIVAAASGPPRFQTVLLGLFATLALVLAAIGVYGVVSYSVAQRTQELGVRMALGAAARDVRRLIVGQGLKLALAGVGLGAIGALALNGWMRTLVFGVSVFDPLTFAVVGVLLVVVAVAACWIPARRATRIDPLSALRCD
jgi:putative ABC transport system permease protein